MRGRNAVVVVALVGCHGGPAALPDAATIGDGAAAAVDAGTVPVEVPHTAETITIDGDWNETDWNQRSIQLVFVDDSGMQARPYSEVRFLYDATNLYIGAYAADEDIEPGDFFQFTVGSLDFRIDPYGHVTASEPGITAAAEYDGTIGDSNDYDEEWLLEAAVPLALVGLDQQHPSPMRASRCDVPKSHDLRCGAVAATLIATGSLAR